MNRKIYFTFLILFIVGAVGNFAFVKNQAPSSPIDNTLPPSKSDQPVAPSPSAEEKILEITLEVNAPFSTAKLTIFEDGNAIYSEKMTGQPEQRGIYEEVDIKTRDLQMKKFVGLVEKNNFFSMEDKPKRPGDPVDG